METIRNLMLIGLFGALGAVSRYGISLGIHRWAGDQFPAGTFVVNMAGCLLLGVLYGLTESRPEASHALSPAVRDALMIGYLGALTTFSTFSLDTVKCFERQAPTIAVVYVLASVLLGLAAAYGGLQAARSLSA